MSRRKNPNAAEALLDLAAMLPWWLDVALAVVFYALLHRVASHEVAVAVRPDQMGEVVTGAMWKGLATAGQYLLPFLFLLGAVVSALRRRERRRLVDGVTQGRSPEVLDGISWREFETLVGEAFRLRAGRSRKPTAASTSCCTGTARRTSCSASSGRRPRSACRSCASSTASWPHGVPRAVSW
jgi:hypothetical protein